ncbi:TlpA disulfide reductase family protein [Pedobacter frigidisoli]|uniref:TlpA family protein disulfide reductase n=1 Tax=Pedobacter frigidisoli TaxID=2530455 RepID=UPI0029316A32|nr:TlpA disulfide reductase family protein [Pedobacter frigidisoli]
MQKNTFFSVVALLCLNVTSSKLHAQSKSGPTVAVAPVKIGSILPESFWKQEHNVYENGKTSKQTLEKYKGKLLILDFWATWCSSCTKRFKYLDSIQKEYTGLTVVLLVDAKDTRDTPEKIAKMMKRFDDQLSTIVGDTILTRQFIHTYVPNYIWIAGGQFLASSGSEFMHKGNLDAILNRQQALKDGEARRAAAVAGKR